MFRNYFVKIIYPYEDIVSLIQKVSDRINAYYKSFGGEEIVVIAVLEGGIVFSGHLLLNLDFNLFFKSLKVINTDPNNLEKKENLKVIANIKNEEIKEKRILILDTLIDTGLTLECVCNFIKEFKPKEIKICTLFKKEKNKDKDSSNPPKNLVEPDWFGALIPNQWVAGFGLDSRNKYRNIKHLGVVRIEKR